MKNLFAKIKQSKKIQAILGAILIVIIIASGIFYIKTNGRVEIETSLINAPLISINSTTTGIVKKIYVTEGQTVKKGDTLAIVGSETVYANTNGVIVKVNNQIGGTVNPQVTLIQMVNPTDMRVDGTIDENKGLNDIKVGQVVSFTIDALPGQTFWGYVDEVAPTAKQTQAAFSISSERPTQQFDVYARFDSATYNAIKNGMSAKMTIFTK
jgi:multidrug resistance efflux pump